jgi:hypothetical protein
MTFALDYAASNTAGTSSFTAKIAAASWLSAFSITECCPESTLRATEKNRS